MNYYQLAEGPFGVKPDPRLTPVGELLHNSCAVQGFGSDLDRGASWTIGYELLEPQ